MTKLLFLEANSLPVENNVVMILATNKRCAAFRIGLIFIEISDISKTHTKRQFLV